MKILDVMLSDTIKHSAAYRIYLTKCRNGDALIVLAQPSESIQGRGREKGYVKKGGFETIKILGKKRNITIVDNILEDLEQALELVVSVNIEEERK
nr:hypothetical protein [Tanacetum cinerariifolium]